MTMHTKNLMVIIALLLLGLQRCEKLSAQEILPIKELKTLYAPTEWMATATFWQENLAQWMNLDCQLTTKGRASIQLQKAAMDSPEAFCLDITRKGITIQASTAEGVSRAFASLLLQMAAHTQGLATTRIEEKPRFGYRGLMIDCSRHFWTIDQLKQDIRMMALCRFNRLHLHLTDNQGWRLYLESHPEVARKGTHYAEWPALSDRYYTKEQLKELVAYAAAAGIEIIPEIDFPGHCQALLTAMPELSCRGGEFHVYPEEYEGERTRPGENMLCVSNPDTYLFINDVIHELTTIFPSKFIHLGGDEVSTHIWKQCPRCQALFAHEKMNTWNELQDYFTQRLSRMVRSKGRIMMGWDEINDRQAACPEDILMIWQTNGRKQQRMATERGLQMVLSPKDPCYFDFGYARNSTRRVYEWEPLDPALKGADAPLVMGGQANLWTEFVADQHDLERMLWPRACALAEVLWYPPQQKSWEAFTQRLASYQKIFACADTDFTLEEELDNPGFVPYEEHIPPLKEAAQITTNIGGIRYYNKEYVFDGDEHTFFATPYSLPAGSSMTLTLDQPQVVKGIQVLFDASKEHPDVVKLQIDDAQGGFITLPSTLNKGVLTASFDQPRRVKAIKIELPVFMMARLGIREIMLVPTE